MGCNSDALFTPYLGAFLTPGFLTLEAIPKNFRTMLMKITSIEVALLPRLREPGVGSYGKAYEYYNHPYVLRLHPAADPRAHVTPGYGCYGHDNGVLPDDDP